MTKPPRVTDDDHAAWALYLRTVKLLPGRAPVELAPAPTASPAAAPPKVPIERPPMRLPPRLAWLTIGENPGGVDKSSWSRFCSGKLPVARKLDLHAHTAEQAHRTLRDFLAQAHADRLRVVEIVTGRGAGPEGGVLRRELPIWLNLPEVRPMILAAAHPHAANPGSVRLLLRRAAVRK